MFRNAFAFVVVASALAFTGCSKCSEQPVAAPVVETPAVAPMEGATPAADGAAAPAAPADAAPMVEPTPAGK